MIRKKVRSFSATDREVEMLEAIAGYHGMSKSAILAGLIKKEFWRIYPGGKGRIKSDRGAVVRVGTVEGEEK